MSGKHSAPHRRRWPRRLLIVVNVFVGLAILAAASAYAYVRYQLDQVKRVTVPGLYQTGVDKPGSQSPKVQGVSVPPFTMLVIGSDTRSLTGNTSAFGTASEDPGQRSDSIILLRVVPDKRSLAVFSIPRDTLVPIPGYGTTRINAAFNSGNAALLVKVLNQDFGIQVNHVAEFNFDTFEDIANAIGGVYQWFPTPARDLYSNLEVAAPGCVLLKGATALAFARSREYQYYLNGEWNYQYFPESDLGRIQRQQDFFKLAARKAQKIAPTNPLALNSLVSSLIKDVTLDKGFSTSLILDLVRDFRHANLSSIPSFVYPTMNSTSVPGALDPEVALGRQTIQQWLKAAQPASTSSPETATTAPPTSKAPSKPTTPPTTAISPARVAIEVINGSGVAGQAATAASDLSSLGYRTTIGGDGSFDHQQTVVDYAPDSRAAAEQLQRQLIGGATLNEDTGLAPSPYNLEVITGQSFGGVSSSSSASTTTRPTEPTTTTTLPPETNPAIVGTATVQADSSSFYKGQYIPPGRVPGQIPQTCPS